MGRHENPVSTDLKYNGLLAVFLRRRRGAGGWSYQEIAEQGDFSRQTLQRAAAGGMSTPSWPVVESFVIATRPYWESDDDLQRAIKSAKSIWRKARYEERQKTRPRRPEPPVLGLVRNEADVAAVLVELYERAGAPSMKAMEERAGGMGILPHSTAHRIVTRKALPYSFDQFDAFLAACEVDPRRREPWHNMWRRVFGQPQKGRVRSAAEAVAEALKALI
ncbi:helix-turn-helix domain-containing protein [Streptomyces sp. NPDC102282]|uniref:helix-turn-helix domain-containing protein n=1 Tax=Streptomyces sp. NPDC102282 TaxID=3366154 RepID=UPI0037FC0B85